MPMPKTDDPGLEWLPRSPLGTNLQRIDVQFLSGCQRLYSYAWGGPETLAVGDVVRTPRPPRWRGRHDGRARVVNLRSGYEGPIRTVTERVR